MAEGERDLYAQRNAGGEFRRDTDDGGHLIANRFEGSGCLENLVPEDRSVNRGAYKTMENHWANELIEGNRVNLDVTPIYHGDSLRPDSILTRTEITDGDKSTIDYFSVTNENLESKEFEIPEDAEVLGVSATPAAGGIAAPGDIAAPGQIAAPGVPAKPGE